MSDVYGVGPSSYDPAVTDPALQVPTGTPGIPAIPPDLASTAAAAAGGPVVALLLQVATILGVNPTQLASAVVANPEAVSAELDATGVPGPDATAGAAADTGVGEALVGSAPIDYGYDPTSGLGAGVQPGLSAPSVSAPLPQDAPAAGTGTDVGVVPTAQAAPPTSGDLGALLAGVVPPDVPTPPQIGGGGAPQPNSIQRTGMDEIIRAALAVARPQSQGLTLNDAIRRS